MQKLLVRQVQNNLKLWSCTDKVGRCVINMCTQLCHIQVAFIVVQVSQTNRRRSSCVHHLYTDDLLWRNFLSPQCRKLLTWPWRHPLKEHSLITRLRLRMGDPCTKFEVSSVNRCGRRFYIHTTHLFNGPFPGLPGWAGTRKVNQSGFYWSKRQWVAVASCSRQITTPAPHHSVFLQARYPSCCPTNSVKALKAVILHGV